MVKDYIDYADLIDRAMQYVVRMALEDVAKHGLPRDHHFFITFKTRGEGVMVSEEILKKYPEEMTIVLQHQYYDLEVTKDWFSVVLSFDNVKHNLTIPYSSLVSFVDPSVKFGLQFSQATVVEEKKPTKQLVKDKVEKQKNNKSVDKTEKSKTNVVTMDAFRNKKGRKDV
ncbi:MAG TPA: hypothetical protein DIV86_07590 [Alphaproteobacteria bacterium]|nr:hypothetical protein [Alphaproteobacteria bacterium]